MLKNLENNGTEEIGLVTPTPVANSVFIKIALIGLFPCYHFMSPKQKMIHGWHYVLNVIINTRSDSRLRKISSRDDVIYLTNGYWEMRLIYIQLYNHIISTVSADSLALFGGWISTDTGRTKLVCQIQERQLKGGWLQPLEYIFPHRSPVRSR